MRLRFETNSSYQLQIQLLSDDRRSNSLNVASLNILVHDVIILLYYRHWPDKRKHFYIYQKCIFFLFVFPMCKKVLLSQTLFRKFPKTSNSKKCRGLPIKCIFMITFKTKDKFKNWSLIFKCRFINAQQFQR